MYQMRVSTPPPRSRNKRGRFLKSLYRAQCGTYSGYYSARYKRDHGEPHCGPCVACRQAKRDYDNARTPLPVRQRKMRERAQRRYGITVEEKLAIYEEQGSCCAICSRSTRDPLNWATEHSHSTGEVRGVTCRSCNHLLGNATQVACSEDPNVLAEYLGPRPLAYLRHGPTLVRAVLARLRSK